MRQLFGSGLILCIIATTGCVSSETHSRALGDVNEARKAATDARNESIPSKNNHQRTWTPKMPNGPN